MPLLPFEDTNRLEEIDTRFRHDEERIQVVGKARGDVLFVSVTYATKTPAESYRSGRPHDISSRGCGVVRRSLSPPSNSRGGGGYRVSRCCDSDSE
jgi:hypothetical protein